MPGYITKGKGADRTVIPLKGGSGNRKYRLHSSAHSRPVEDDYAMHFALRSAYDVVEDQTDLIESDARDITESDMTKYPDLRRAKADLEAAVELLKEIYPAINEMNEGRTLNGDVKHIGPALQHIWAKFDAAMTLTNQASRTMDEVHRKNNGAEISIGHGYGLGSVQADLFDTDVAMGRVMGGLKHIYMQERKKDYELVKARRRRDSISMPERKDGKSTVINSGDRMFGEDGALLIRYQVEPIEMEDTSQYDFGEGE